MFQQVGPTDWKYVEEGLQTEVSTGAGENIHEVTHMAGPVERNHSRCWNRSCCCWAAPGAHWEACVLRTGTSQTGSLSLCREVCLASQFFHF